MAKLVVLYRKPGDTAAFDNYYFAHHVPLAKTIPGLEQIEVSDGPVSTPQGDSAYHLVATLSFDTMDDLMGAFASEKGQRTAADLANFADGGAEMLVFDSRIV
jgi:uncharacterized protein (TIGR02118 family)